MKTQYLLWDNDGVLVDTEYWYFKATQEALRQLGIELGQPQYLQIMRAGESSWQLACNAGFDPAEIKVQQAHRDRLYEQYLAHENIEIPGVVDVLQQLAQSYQMAIVTTSKRTHFDLIHRNRNIVDCMDFVIAREDYTYSKPHPEPYLQALRKYGAKPGDALVIEDSQRGLRSALAADIDCVVVDNAFTRTHDFTGATYSIGSLAELFPLLESQHEEATRSR